MNKNSSTSFRTRGFAILPIILIIAGILVAAGGGVYLYKLYRQQPPVDKERQNISDETANWKTYRNENYGFEIKYPSVPEIKVWDNQAGLMGEGAVMSVSFENMSANRSTAGRKNIFNVTVFKDYNELQKAYKDDNTLQSQGEIIIDGYSARKFLRPKKGTEAEITVYLIDKKNISIFFTDSNYNEIKEKDLNIIISTFKFIK